MRKSYLAVVLCLVFASSCFAQSAPKATASFKDSGQPKVVAATSTDKEMGTGNAKVTYHYAADATFESVNETTYSSPVDSSIVGLTAVLNKKLMTDSTKSMSAFTSVNVLGMVGLTGTATTSTSTIHIEVFASGNVLYIMTAIIKNTADQTEAQKFFDSFVLTN